MWPRLRFHQNQKFCILIILALLKCISEIECDTGPECAEAIRPNTSVTAHTVHPKFSTPILLNRYSDCRWILDLSTSRDPFRLWTTYFNERDPWDVREQLDEPNTTRYLEPVRQRGSDNEVYNVFPYFLVVRGVCDDGAYSDTLYHALFQQGIRPAIQISYRAPTSRVTYVSSIEVTITPAGSALTPDRGFNVIPRNKDCPDNSEDHLPSTHSNSRVGICYPGFLAPLVLLGIPIFRVNIAAVGPFEKLAKTVYVTPFHSRKQEGVGEIELAHEFRCNVIGNGTTAVDIVYSHVMAKYFFPLERIGSAEDPTLGENSNALLEMLFSAQSDTPISVQDKNHSYYPLDSDDFFHPQFTYGSAPSVAIAGFYQPDLILISDPDMNSINLFLWGFNQGKNASIFTDDLKCTSGKKIIKGSETFDKVMYTEAYKMDTHFFSHYRARYAFMDHLSTMTHSIFEIISMEDRFLILTSNGLVVLYGNSNVTVATDRVLRAFDSEKRLFCYKFVRILNVALMQYDPLVAITYDYEVANAGGGSTRIEQEVHYARLHNPGTPLEWVRIGKDEFSDRDVRPPESGTATGQEIRQEDLTEAIKICLEVKKTEIDPHFREAAAENAAFNWRAEHNIEPEHECTILDGSPVPTAPDTVQLLVIMTFTFFKNSSCTNAPSNSTECNFVDQEVCLSAGPGNDVACPFNRQKIRLYVIAEHVVKQVVLEGSSWKIVSVTPQIPCQGTQTEGVRNILAFGGFYFGLNNERMSCFEQWYFHHTDHLYLTRISYTRQISNHMFLFGNRLLHSLDAGRSFSLARTFPHPDNYKIKNSSDLAEVFKAIDYGHKHYVKIFAFGDDARYAFLTSRRELWVGTVGHNAPIRLRAAGQILGISQLQIFEEHGVDQGVPFTVLYDSFNNLFELVAIKNATTKEVVKIVKRSMNFEMALRNAFFVDRLKTITEKQTQRNESVVHYEISEATISCSFNKFSATQNYSGTIRRTQSFNLARPSQHRDLGLGDNQQTLMAFQVSAFKLVHDAYLNPQTNFYNNIENDPFDLWAKSKGAATFIGIVKYYKEDPTKFGIVVDPRTNIREKDFSSSVNSVRYFLNLDYNDIVQFDMTFFIKSTYKVARTDFVKEKLESIQLNIDNENSNLIKVDAHRKVIAKFAAVNFTFFLSLIQDSKLKQSLPGRGIIQVPINFHFIGAFGRCFDLPHWGTRGESVSIFVNAGCPPTTDVLFDWNSTLHSLKFRHENLKYGDSEQCYDNAFVCFYARAPIIFFFDALIVSRQVYVPFHGKFKMRIVGGGYTNTTIKDYTESQQEAYNIPGHSDVSLIWTIANKGDDEEEFEAFETSKDPNTGENILQSGVTRIKWTCNTLSPCARIAPTWTGRTVFWFKVRISNKDVDPNTLCLHEREILIMVYGFPPSPEVLLFTTIMTCLFLIFMLLLVFYCCRQSRRVWRAQKIKIWGWVQVIGDTFPKPLKIKADMDDKEQKRKDTILLSLQGHLGVPTLLQKERKEEQKTIIGAPPKLDSELKPSGSGASALSLEGSSTDVLPGVSPRKPATTWTEMVYEQIISRRLLAIVERNKRMREALRRKVQEQVEAKEKAEKHRKTPSGTDDD